MKLINSVVVGFAFLSLVPLLGGFYWLQLRPAKIKHDCSWVQIHKDATEAVRGWDDFTEQEKEKIREESLYGEYIYKYRYPGLPASPEQDYWDKASEEEYSFCIQEHGL